MSLPHEDFLYLGDTARFPYGDRTAGRSCSASLGSWRASCSSAGAKLLVVACNSATAAALPALRERARGARARWWAWSRRSRGSLRRRPRNGRVGLIATPATVASGAYARALARGGAGRRAPRRRLRRAGAADPGGRGGRRARGRLRRGRSAARSRQAGVDTVILGCTHYPLVRPVLQRALGRGVSIVSSGEAIAAEVDARLRRGRARSRTRTGAATTASLRPATPRSSGVSARGFSSCPSARSSTWRWPPSRQEGRMSGAPQRRPRAGRPARDRDHARLRAHRHRLGSDRGRRHARDLHGERRRGACPRWMAGKGRGWVTAEYGMLPASTGERKQRDVSQGPPRRPHRRDPAPDRPLAARRRSTSRRSASAPSGSTATCSRPTAARAARRSPAATWRSSWRCAA